MIFLSLTHSVSEWDCEYKSASHKHPDFPIAGVLAKSHSSRLFQKAEKPLERNRKSDLNGVMRTQAKNSDDVTDRYGLSARHVHSVYAGIHYVAASPEPLYNYMYEPLDGSPQHNCKYELHTVCITDARDLSATPSIHAEGFELWDAPSEIVNFRDDDQVRSVYYQECAALACAVTGGKRGYVFDHQIRKREAGRPSLTFGRHGDGTQAAAAGRIHNDYTEDSGRRRLALVLGDAEEAKSVQHYCIVNVWRSIAGPVVDTPLAVCDSRSVAASDLQVSEVRYATRKGEIYLLSHSPRHKWFYYSEMERHEALVFKQYDSQVRGVTRFTPHTAFDLPFIPAHAPLRESIEVRCLVVMN